MQGDSDAKLSLKAPHLHGAGSASGKAVFCVDETTPAQMAHDLAGSSKNFFFLRSIIPAKTNPRQRLAFDYFREMETSITKSNFNQPSSMPNIFTAVACHVYSPCSDCFCLYLLLLPKSNKRRWRLGNSAQWYLWANCPRPSGPEKVSGKDGYLIVLCISLTLCLKQRPQLALQEV